jgi:hypothetical protein
VANEPLGKHYFRSTPKQTAMPRWLQPFEPWNLKNDHRAGSIFLYDDRDGLWTSRFRPLTVSRLNRENLVLGLFRSRKSIANRM